jgi:signal peptidase I
VFVLSDNKNVEKKTDNETEEESIKLSQIIYDIAGTIFLAIILLFITMTFFARQVTVDGPSMKETLHDKDRLLVSCFDYVPKNGDIVIVTHGENLDEPIVKRVIATAGQHLEINYANGEVSVDGKVLDEKYIVGTTIPVPNATVIPEVIPDGYVFVMGDNREHSLDSRSATVGLVPVENIIGKAFIRIYPFDSFGFV